MTTKQIEETIARLEEERGKVLMKYYECDSQGNLGRKHYYSGKIEGLALAIDLISALKTAEKEIQRIPNHLSSY